MGNIATSCTKEYPYVFSKFGVDDGCCNVKPSKRSCPERTISCPTLPQKIPCKDYMGKNNVILIGKIYCDIEIQSIII